MTPVAAAPSSASTSVSECARSSEMSRTRSPVRASAIAVAAASVVFPTPPLPMKNRIWVFASDPRPVSLRPSSSIL
jgi:hypothetical protein